MSLDTLEIYVPNLFIISKNTVYKVVLYDKSSLKLLNKSLKKISEKVYF